MQAKFAVILLAIAVASCSDYVEQRDCGRVQVNVSDSLIMSSRRVLDVIDREYGCCIGKNLDSLDLGFIEAALDSCAVVKKSQAWITRDGVLHLRVTTRTPAILLSDGNLEVFCDPDGYLFPIGGGSTKHIRRISGEIPIKMRAGMHGQPPTEFQRRWLKGVMDLVGRGFDGEISVCGGGELRLLPADSSDEVFLFGLPDDIDAKLAKMKEYTGRIRPLQQYKSVNLKYKGQIICRKDI